MNDMRAEMLTTMNMDDVESQQKELQQMKDASTKAELTLSKLRSRFLNDKELAPLVNQLSKVKSEFVETRDKQLIQYILLGQIKEAKQLSNGIEKQRFEEMRQLSSAIASSAASRAQLAVLECQQQASRSILYVLGAGGLALMWLLILAAFVGKVISQPLQKITEAAERIAAGDLEVTLPHKGRLDEVGILSNAFASMLDSLQSLSLAAQKVAHGDLSVKVVPRSKHDMLGKSFSSMVDNLSDATVEIVDATLVLNTAAASMSNSMSNLVAASAQTATAITQTTTTVSQVRQTSNLSARKAQEVAEQSEKTAMVSNAGFKASEETIAVMKEIREQMDLIYESMLRLSSESQSIGEIVATVDSLAQQSNILAVNAAIEAASAGEHGRGFSVVASEVKRMVDKSRQATNRINTILSDIQSAISSATNMTERGRKAVDAAVHQALEASNSIMALSDSVVASAEAAAQISISSREQVSGVDQVADAMLSISEVIKQNSLVIKQVELTAAELTRLSKRFSLVSQRYKI